MNIPYRTRRLLNSIGIILLTLLLILVITWLCWVIWLERYIVYTRDGAVLDLDFSSNDLSGEVATPPGASSQISIFYNEGENAIEITNELTQLDGYYISSEMLSDAGKLAQVWDLLAPLPAGTPVMIDLKAGYGSFYYTSSLGDAVQSASVPAASIDEMIEYMRTKGFYIIGRVCAFRDYNFGLHHVQSGLYMTSRAGLWSDEGGCYWLDPTNATTLNWISSVVLELRDMGLNEVVLNDFRFPISNGYIFNDDKEAALQKAAQTLVDNCAQTGFTLSFSVDNAGFPLPEGRTRLYLTGVGASNVGARASLATMEDPQVRLVFVAETNDTRYNEYGVLRDISVSTVLEMQKADAEGGAGTPATP